MSVFKNNILFDLKNCTVTVYKDGRIEIAWKTDIPADKASSILTRLNQFVPTKFRWRIRGNIASTELNSLEAHLLETSKSEQERLRTAADIPINN